MNSDNRKEDLQCIVLGFVLHAVVMENDHGIGMSFSSRKCSPSSFFLEKGSGRFWELGLFPQNTPSGGKNRCESGDIFKAD